MRFSIIIPVYNVANYIRKCLDSIVNQDFTDYEIVVVDDESPDNSMQIVEEYVKSYPDRFQIIHQKNKGLGGARNTGALAAKGEYLFFIDSDDYIEPGTLRELDEMLRENPCDILMFQYNEVEPSGKLIGRQMSFSENGLCSTPQQKAPLLLVPPSAWSKIVRREFFLGSEVQFPEKTLYEDGVMRILVAKAENIYVCKDHFYNYVQRSGSIMNSKVSPRVLDIIKVTDLVYDTFVKEGLMEYYQSEIEAALIQAAFHVVEGIYKQSRTDPLMHQIIAYMQTRFPDFRKNPVLASRTIKEICYLAEGQSLRYRYAKMVKKTKEMLYAMPVVYRMNALRKKLMGRQKKK